MANCRLQKRVARGFRKLALKPYFRAAPLLFPSLEIDEYLTKVREWTKASCKAFAASIAL